MTTKYTALAITDSNMAILKKQLGLKKFNAWENELVKRSRSGALYYVVLDFLNFTETDVTISPIQFIQARFNIILNEGWRMTITKKATPQKIYRQFPRPPTPPPTKEIK